MQFLNFYLPKIGTIATVRTAQNTPILDFHKPKIVETCRNSARIDSSSNIDFQAIIFAKIYL